MKFQLDTQRRNVPEEELIADILRVRDLLAKEGATITGRSYTELGQFTAATIKDRFGAWNAGLAAAGIEVANEKDISETELFKNLERVWTTLGRQPRVRDIAKPMSKYSADTYKVRFGTWNNALQRFVEYINTDADADELNDEAETISSKEELQQVRAKKRTKRHISDRMRFRILSRDGFTCQSCGASPIKQRGVELHVDHVIPWSKGGETEESNLKTKCAQCNLGKGNAFFE